MASNPPTLIPLSQAAEAVGVPVRTMRYRVGKLPEGAKRKIRREWHIDPRYVPQLLTAMARRNTPSDPDDRELWRTRDAARDATVRRIVEDADTFAAARRGKLTDADKSFCNRFGDGAFYGIRFRSGTLRRWRRVLKRGGSFAEKRGRQRGGTSAKIGLEA